MATNVVEDDDYSSLKDFKLEIVDDDGDVNRTFAVCFWVYLPPDSASFPSTLLRQHYSDVTSASPFLVLNENKELVLYPIHFQPQEAPIPSSRSNFEVPLNKWIHIGYEVSNEAQCLYINAEIVQETRVTCDFGKDSQENGLKKVSLVGPNEDDLIEGYIHGVKILPTTSSIKDFLFKDPLVQLHVDSKSAIDIDEESDGVWSVVGGKASCRRNFSLDVVLMDASGHLVNKEMEVVATLTYADNATHVERPDDEEAPLLTSCDGIEFASWDRPSKLLNGRASFKLKISQLSSKCDNRLFRIKFDIPKVGRRYRFLEVFSRPIRCISRNRNTRPSTVIWKKAVNFPNGASVEPLDNIIHEAKQSPSSKRIKLGQVYPFSSSEFDNSSKYEEHNEDNRVNIRTLEGLPPETLEEADNCSTDSDSSEATNSCKSMNGSPVSDVTVFKYCLGNLSEKSLLLKEMATSASRQDLHDFAMQVSQFSGCLHHRNQIEMSKRLIEDGTNAWNLMSQNNFHVSWDIVIPVLQDHFKRISSCRVRFLTQQDFDVLMRIGGCQDSVGQENFEKVWCWLYPVAFGLSRNGLNEMWDSRWVEGLVTKEEAEGSLHGEDPGTFVLRFPTSRSWPHPDAGNIIVTYVGSDYVIHHRLISLDFIHRSGRKSLKEMLLEERELSRLGRITTRISRLV